MSDKHIMKKIDKMANHEDPDETEGAPVLSGLSASLLVQRFGFDARLRRNPLNHNWGSIAHSLSLSSAHRPDMTEIL